jgi:hypothetical protein
MTGLYNRFNKEGRSREDIEKRMLDSIIEKYYEDPLFVKYQADLKKLGLASLIIFSDGNCLF